MKRYFFRLAFLMLPCVFLAHNSRAQTGTLANADTSGFSVNAAGGWQLLNSFVGPAGADSAQIELILQCPGAVSLSSEKYVGLIRTPSLRPLAERLLYCPRLSITYRLRIDVDGKCHLSCAGSPPVGKGNILTVPFLAMYRL